MINRESSAFPPCAALTRDVFYLAARLPIYLVSPSAAATVIIFARKSIYIFLKVPLPHLCPLCFSWCGQLGAWPAPCNHSFRHFTKLYRRRSFSLLICFSFLLLLLLLFFRLARNKKSFYLNKFLSRDMRGISI